MTKKCVVILSGGQDSTTALYMARQHFDDVHAITFDYGQRHRIEIQAATVIAELAGVTSHEVCDIKGIMHSTSPLTSDAELEQYTDADQMAEVIGDRRELTFVPMRNALFLMIAANRAAELGADAIVLGVCQMDNANYDDCREIFLQAAGGCIATALGLDHREGTSPIRIIAPLLFLNKAETVMIAHSMPECWEAMAYTHTSYDGKYPPTDMNHANVLRAQGFEMAGLPDPLVIRAHSEGLMELPASSNYDGLRT